MDCRLNFTRLLGSDNLGPQLEKDLDGFEKELGNSGDAEKLKLLSDALRELASQTLSLICKLELRQMAEFKVAIVSAREVATRSLGEELSKKDSCLDQGSLKLNSYWLNSLRLAEETGALLFELQSRTEKIKSFKKISNLASSFQVIRSRLLANRVLDAKSVFSNPTSASSIICQEIGATVS